MILQYYNTMGQIDSESKVLDLLFEFFFFFLFFFGMSSHLAFVISSSPPNVHVFGSWEEAEETCR